MLHTDVVSLYPFKKVLGHDFENRRMHYNNNNCALISNETIISSNYNHKQVTAN